MYKTIFKYELHCHTSQVSRCGTVSGADAARMYKDAGYDGVVITDHYSPMTFSLLTVCRPQAAADFYMSGYRSALSEADDDFTVLLGMELRYYATANDYLVFGVTEDFLKNSGNLMAMYPRRFYKKAHENGLLVVQAHPFREMMIRTNPKYLDGCEIYNGKQKSESESENAERWAEENNMKIRTSGSDFHRPKNLAMGGIETDRRIRTNADLLDVLKKNEFSIIKNGESCRTAEVI